MNINKVDNSSIQLENAGQELKTKNAKALGGSIFIQDNNNTVELSDIKDVEGNTKLFQSLVDLLKPYVLKKTEWTQDLIKSVETLIKQHNKDVKNGEGEIEFSTEKGWTQLSQDLQGRATQLINEDGQILNRKYDSKNDYSETYTDYDGNPIFQDFNGKQYNLCNKYVNGVLTKVLGIDENGKEFLLQQKVGNNTETYTYNEQGSVEIKRYDQSGKEISINYEGMTRINQYMNYIKDQKYMNASTIDETSEKRFIKSMISADVVDKKGNINRSGNNEQKAGSYTPTTEDKANMKKVFSNTQFVDNFSDHNQMLDAIEYAQQHGVDTSNVTSLITFDTHSDIYYNSPSGESIANWVNACVAKNPSITDVYWVVSDNMVEDSEFGALLEGRNRVMSTNSEHKALVQNVRDEGCTNLKEEEDVQKYYINSAGKLLTDIPRPTTDLMPFQLHQAKKKGTYEEISNNKKYTENWREIRVHISTEKNLPNFKSQKVITTFDMDYFSNSGVDTTTFYRDNKTAEELNEAFSKAIKTMAEHDIKPVIHGNCYSEDDYLPSEDLEQCKQFANEIIKSSPQKEDKLPDEEYKHHHLK